MFKRRVPVATPAEDFTVNASLPAGFAVGRYRVRAEVNSSYDFNDVYKDDVKGQPSLVYEGILDIGSTAADVRLEYTGFGDPLGKNGEVTRRKDGITSALGMISEIRVTFTEIKS